MSDRLSAPTGRERGSGGAEPPGLTIDYALLNTAMPLDHALFNYLSMRERLTRVR